MYQISILWLLNFHRGPKLFQKVRGSAIVLWRADVLLESKVCTLLCGFEAFHKLAEVTGHSFDYFITFVRLRCFKTREAGFTRAVFFRFKHLSFLTHSLLLSQLLFNLTHIVYKRKYFLFTEFFFLVLSRFLIFKHAHLEKFTGEIS